MSTGVGSIERKVFVAMSGGVDSSVAAFLLKEKGYEVTGVFMRCYNIDGCAERDAEDARRAADHLKIPFYTFDFEEEYKRRVVDYMIEGYRRGITPNPDVMCNKEIKFGLFLEKALDFGANHVATGHYVRLMERTSSNEVSLFEAKDKNKDQSYFLWTLTQNQLKNCLFPVGNYLKSEIRDIARKAGLPTAEKKDSQGICFLGRVTLSDFLKDYIPEKPGEVLDIEGGKIGEHRGAWFYTIGQRHIGIANRRPTLTSRGLTRKENFLPLYVAGKDIQNNTVIVVEGNNNPSLYRKEIELTDVNFVNPALKIKNYKLKIPVMVRVRYRQPLAPASLMKLKNKSYKLIFNDTQKFIAPGQSAVFYSSDGELIGGGVII